MRFTAEVASRWAARYLQIPLVDGELQIPALDHEPVDRIGRGISCLWLIAYSSCAISELEVCDSCDDRGNILRARLDENWFAAAGCARACAGGYFLARAVSLRLPSVLR